jgi:hypothetical protein
MQIRLSGQIASSSPDGDGARMNIFEATRSYEKWMRCCTTVVESHLRMKHERMRNDPFLFLRGTYYRWIQLFPELCKGLRSAPKVLSSGDLHVGNFGTWRDAEGRLCWGVDDFDEAFPLPYTNDLVRLAASMRVMIDSQHLTIKWKYGCDVILEGYHEALKRDGCPFVLAEKEQALEKLGLGAIKQPRDFWKKLQELPGAEKDLPRDARTALEKELPGKKLRYRVVRREAGVGSLGQQRLVAITNWQGGCIAREAKAMVPSASVWLANRAGQGQSFYDRAIQSAVRSHDPFQKVTGRWLIRRLSPDSSPIEIENLPKGGDEERLLHAMASETANVHLGSRRQVKRILKDLRSRKASWLRSSTKEMANAMMQEWKEYRSVK